MKRLARFVCWALGHSYYIVRKLAPSTRQVGCWRCKRRWAMNDPTRSFLPWDSELEELYKPGGILDPILLTGPSSDERKGAI